MTIKNLYPTQRPTYVYNVINGRAELPVNSTFTRASVGTYVNSSGLIVDAAANAPRFDHDPDTREFLGLLLETEGKNYVTESDLCGNFNSAVANILKVVESNVDTPAGIGQCISLSVADTSQDDSWRIGTASGGDGSAIAFSVYVKTVDGVSSTDIKIRLNNSNTASYDYTVGPEWTRIDISGGYLANSQRRNVSIYPTETPIYLWGAVISISQSQNLGTVDTLNEATSYIRNTSALLSDGPAIREPDFLSLASTSNFNSGFSMMTDSDAGDVDYIYKINSNGSEISQLANNAGTLEWTIDGVSAQTAGSYPQVGFVKGRTRTISSFGPADGESQDNYLYTTGLSFPTAAVVAPDADQIEFGVPQLLKALYVWDGQLDETNAVSLIKGKYNIVSSAPIQPDAYSFIFDPDPTSVGNTNVTFPELVPNNNMTIDWGDGNTSAYEVGVVPSHDYPYPGKYRVQVKADDGLANLKVQTTADQINKVEAWHPDYRIDASGDGFTGNQLVTLLAEQSTCTYIPEFKYTNITSLQSTFRGNKAVLPRNAEPYWPWVPVDLPDCTSLFNTFSQLGYTYWFQNQSSPAYTKFPQLQTSDKLVNVSNCFKNSRFTGWLTPSNSFTNKPFTDTSNVTDWSACFKNSTFTDIDVDTSAATNLKEAFYQSTEIVTFPFIQTSNCERFESTWYGCSNLQTFPLITTSEGTNFKKAWAYCTQLNNFPELDFSKSTTMLGTWQGCSSLTSLPELDLSECTILSLTFSESGLLVSPVITNLTKCTSFYQAWSNCPGITTFTNIGNLDFSKTTTLYNTFSNSGFTGTVPSLNVSNECLTLQGAFASANITGFASALDTSGCTTFRRALSTSSITEVPDLSFISATNFYTFCQNCSSLTDIDSGVFDVTGTLDSNAFDAAFTGCALTAIAIENLLVSLDTNGQSNIVLGIDGGTNAAKSTWTAAAITAFNNLAGDPAVPGDTGKGWTISFNA